MHLYWGSLFPTLYLEWGSLFSALYLEWGSFLFPAWNGAPCFLLLYIWNHVVLNGIDSDIDLSVIFTYRITGLF